MTMDERRIGKEGKFAHAEGLGFEVEAKGSKFLGLWAAEQLGLEGDNAETYARTVVETNLEEPGFDDIFRKVRADFDEKNLDITDHRIHVEIKRSMEKAEKLVMGGV